METFRHRTLELLQASGNRADKAKALAELIRAHRGYHWVGLYDVSSTHISAIAWTGNEAPAFPSFPVTKGLNGAAVAEKKPVIVQDVAQDSRYLVTFGATRGEAIFPVFTPDGSRVIGTIDVESDRVNAFQAEDEAFLQECSALLRPLWN
ncbi:MAG: GAF domain-containing protein [candidate division Zixibacteria bacterium]|nr:GAF domain-containing protein [candidate division Zixibacteria bacterium]